MFVMVIRRYKYLQKSLEAEMTKLLLFLKAFSTENKTKLAKLFAFLLDEGGVGLWYCMVWYGIVWFGKSLYLVMIC